MGFWTREEPAYNRARTFEAAEKARRKGRTSKAIKEYRKILAVDRTDPQVNARIAPLLIKTGKRQEAVLAFETSAESFVENGFVDKALAVYSQAASFFPTNEQIWIRTAELTADRGRKADAIKVLLQGADHLRKSRKTLPQALGLVTRALQIDPMHIAATIALARLLAKSDQKKEAIERLEVLANGIRGPALRKVRAAQFRLSPSPASLWRWFRSGKRAPSAAPSGPVRPPTLPR